MSGRGAPGAGSRGRGGKFKKFTRGGGKHFSRDLRPLDADGNEVSMWSEEAKKKDSDDDSNESEEESEEEESEDDAGPSKQPTAEMTREERRKLKAQQKAAAAAKKKKAVQVGDLPSGDESDESSDDNLPMPANPNHSKAARDMAKAPRQPDADVDAATEGVKKLSTGNNRKGGAGGGGGGASSAPMSRKEREAAEAAAARERYQKLHLAGKTDEAKADMARLAAIREKRAAEAARRQAEAEERDEQEKARRQEINAREAKMREAALGKPAKKSKK